MVSERANDADLVRGFQYACLVRALAFTVPNLQFYYWTTNHNITLHQVGGEDYVKRLIIELQRRGLLSQGEDYLIDFRAMRRWVERKRMPLPASSQTQQATVSGYARIENHGHQHFEAVIDIAVDGSDCREKIEERAYRQAVINSGHPTSWPYFENFSVIEGVDIKYHSEVTCQTK